jgi:hypothetical protein
MEIMFSSKRLIIGMRRMVSRDYVACQPAIPLEFHGFGAGGGKGSGRDTCGGQRAPRCYVGDKLPVFVHPAGWGVAFCCFDRMQEAQAELRRVLAEIETSSSVPEFGEAVEEESI